MINKLAAFVFLLIFFSFQVYGQPNHFNKGINLSGWFQENSPTEIHFKKYTKKDFENIKSLGADVIRLPINLHSMTDGPPNYKLNDLFLNFLDEAVNWAEELNISLILDNHSFDPSKPTDPNIDEILIPVWKNMAEHFKNRSGLIYYEILNEPHGISDSLWRSIQGEVINEIRMIDTNHTIIVGASGFNSYNNLQYLTPYEDENLIYTFHFYEPFLFTHQGASWTDPSLVSLSGVPFPYDASTMPSVPDDLINTWVQWAMQSYFNTGTISYVRGEIDKAVDFKETYNVNIFCGEFGVYKPNSLYNHRLLWYNIVRTYFEYHNIPWTSWDYHGGFGLFEDSDYGLFEHDLDTYLLAALGFNVPPQSEYELSPDSTEFYIYDDFIETGIVKSGSSGGTLNYYNEDSKNGQFSISWENPSQYSLIGFRFIYEKDLSFLKSSNYHIGFWFKGNNPNAEFQLRFVDTKENEEDRPWRMSYDIDFSTTVFNNEWNYVSIPLNQFFETGSWDNNNWYNPEGNFDWKLISSFEIVNEFDKLKNTKIFFDDIKIFNPDSSTNVEDEILADDFLLYQNYPNPFNPSTTIKYSIGKSSFVTLQVFDLLGNEVTSLVNEHKQSGTHRIDFNAQHLSSGIYFYRLISSNKILTKKLTLIK
jgi:endoglucanase